MKIDVEQAKNGTDIIKVSSSNGVVYLNSRYNPLKEVEQWIEQYNSFNDKELILVFGMASLLHIKMIEKRLPQAAIIVCEPNKDIFEVADKSNISKANLVCMAKGDEEFRKILKQQLDWNNQGKFGIIILPQYDNLFSTEFAAFKQIIMDRLTEIKIKKNTEEFYGVKYCENVLANMMYLATSKDMTELIAEYNSAMPIVLVSAGPSLKKNIEVLAKYQKQVFILATDSANKALFSYGITPDVIATLDPDKRIEVFEDERFSEIPLICSLSSSSEALARHKGDKLFIDNGLGYIVQLFKSVNKSIVSIKSGGSIGNDALSIVIAMKPRNIILIGQDLAFSDGLIHMDGIYKNQETDYFLEGDKELYVEDIEGKPVRTNAEFLMYLREFEDTIANNKHINVIDATEGGARIKGASIMSLEAAITKYSKATINKKAELKNLLRENERVLLQQYLKCSADNLLQLSSKCEQTINLCEELLMQARKDSFISQDILNRININNANISNFTELDLINPLITKERYEFVQQYKEFPRNTEEYINNAEYLIQFYKAVTDKSLQINRKMKKT